MKVKRGGARLLHPIAFHDLKVVDKCEEIGDKGSQSW